MHCLAKSPRSPDSDSCPLARAQNAVLTALMLIVYAVGMYWYFGNWSGHLNPEENDRIVARECISMSRLDSSHFELRNGFSAMLN